MKIIQFLPVYSKGDAIGNEVSVLNTMFRQEGYTTWIVAEQIGPGLKGNNVKEYTGEKMVDAEDVAILHLSTGSELNLAFAQLECKKIIIYHNITPPAFFEPFHSAAAKSCRNGLEQVKALSKCADIVIADSEQNKKDLMSLGYMDPVYVIPLLIPFEDYKRKYDDDVYRILKDDHINILSTGRIAPNKGLHHVIAAFTAYKKHYNDKSRLILAGRYDPSEHYYQALKKYCEYLGAENVIFTGHIKFEELLAYYLGADVYLCMSEHEGFCVPLVEAMFFNIPVIAYNSTAIPETLGGSGFLIDDFNPVEVAGVINRIVKDKVLRDEIVGNETERLKRFEYKAIRDEFLKCIKKVIDG